ncbi:uncharacterized protein [Dermacentor andersoni]|uniref:uncharacterized protein n=1 Tax=Dermacentor andersoni TaxID=34620 RepID=UPI003B3B5D79
MPLPKDGLCTLVFFDSVYAGGSSGLGPTGLAGNVMAFLEWAMSSAGGTTQFGVSLAIDDQNLEHEAKTKRFESGISWISGQGIAHFGFLNAYLSYSSPAHITVALNVLKTIDDYLKLRNIRISSTVMALGVAPVYPKEFSSYVELMKYATHNRHKDCSSTTCTTSFYMWPSLTIRRQEKRPHSKAKRRSSPRSVPSRRQPWHWTSTSRRMT